MGAGEDRGGRLPLQLLEGDQGVVPAAEPWRTLLDERAHQRPVLVERRAAGVLVLDERDRAARLPRPAPAGDRQRRRARSHAGKLEMRSAKGHASVYASRRPISCAAHERSLSGGGPRPRRARRNQLGRAVPRGQRKARLPIHRPFSASAVRNRSVRRRAGPSLTAGTPVRGAVVVALAARARSLRRTAGTDGRRAGRRRAGAGAGNRRTHRGPRPLSAARNSSSLAPRRGATERAAPPTAPRTSTCSRSRRRAADPGAPRQAGEPGRRDAGARRATAGSVSSASRSGPSRRRPSLERQDRAVPLRRLELSCSEHEPGATDAASSRLARRASARSAAGGSGGHTALEPEQEMLPDCLDALEPSPVDRRGDTGDEPARMWRDSPPRAARRAGGAALRHGGGSRLRARERSTSVVLVL